jgi:hypothetical protein
MKNCLFCNSKGPYNTTEHIIPESLGNDDLFLSGDVCDSCQNYFGKEVEQFVLNKTPIAFWGTYLGIRSTRKKDGSLPFVDLSLPKVQKGRLPNVHPMSDDYGLLAHTDSSTEIVLGDKGLWENIISGKQKNLKLVLTPLILHMIGRFLCKIGIELVCFKDADLARSSQFDEARNYARCPKPKEMWPVFHFERGNPSQFIATILDTKNERLEKIDCYSYRIIEVYNIYTLLHFSIGTDNWVISLNSRYPTLLIKNAFPSDDLKLIWYSPKELLD